MKKLLTLALFVCGFMQVWAGNITGTWQDDNGITWYYSVHYDSNNPPIYATIEPVNKSSISGTVVIPSTVDGYTVRYINRDAFKECFQLTSVTIPDVVWGIGNSAFYGTGLKSVIIPSSIDNIGDSAFWNCSYLDNVTINSNSLLSSTGTKKTMSKIFTYRVKHYTIGEGVKTIGMMAFFACHMESVTIPTTVTNIGVEAFALCQNLKNVTIPESVTSIGDAAFQNCNSLTNVNISERVKTIFNKTFEGCVSLQSVTIPDSVKTICLDAFAGCTSLKSITIPKSVQYLDKDAFRGCAGLISVTINCRIDEGFGCCYRFGPQVKYYTLGEGITGILPSFSGCTDMESVNIPSCVGISLKNTFNGCTSLKKVIVPNIAAWCNIDFRVEEYGIGHIPDSVDATSNPLSVAKHLYSDENTEITELVIPEGATRITKYAFYGCSGLESVSIPSSMTSIGPGAFRKCNLTKSSIYSDSIISKNYDANHNLYEVFGKTALFDLSKNVASIGDYAFWGYDVNMGMMLPWNMASIGDHSLPRGGLTVYYIVTDLAAFCNNTTQSLLHHKKSDITCVLYDENLSHHIKECIIPDDVTSISDYAFSGCVYLNKVTIPESVTKIGWYAFDGCTYLRCLSIPSSASWGMDSFRNLNSLDTLYCYRPTPPKIYSNTFPNRSKAILYVPYGSKPAYQNADYWKDFKEIKGIPDSYDVWYFELVDSMATIVGSTQTTGDLVIPSVVFKNGTAYPVTSIGGSAFKGCVGLTSITVPQGVTSIGQNAFSGCSGLVTVKVPIIDMAAFCNNQVVGQIYSNLNKPIILIDSEGNEITKLVIPDGVTSIGKSAFRRCTGLTTATIGSGVTSIGNGAFLECTNLTNITIPLGVTTIDQYAFGGCTGLTSVTIPSSVTSIGNSAFGACTGLTNVTIPANSNLSDIGDYAFYNCTNFTTVIVPIIDMAAFCRNTIISMIHSRIKEPVMLIDGDGNEITEYVIPENVTSIGSSAFLNCTGLTSVTIPESVTSIGNYAFEYCSGLTSVTIPEGVTSIGNYAFFGCSSLTSVTIPSSVTSIGKLAFSGCSNLTSLTIGDGLTSIGDYVFSDCTGLTSVTVPESVTSIGKYAFADCSGLTSVTIPSSVTSIGKYAFDGCSSLTNVYCHVATPFSIDSKTFSNRANATLYVPYKTKDAYLAAEYWKEFKEIKEMVDSYDIWQFDISNSTAVILGTSQQSDNLTIPSVVYKDGQEYPVTSIDSGAFAGQTDLTSVTIPQSVTSIGADAFAGCTNLTNVKVIVEDMATFCNNQVVGQIKAGINKPVTLVDREGNEITEYVIPNGVDSIGTNAFNNCTGLTGMTFPQSVTSIGADAFAGCTNLTNVKVIVEDMATFCNNQVVGQIKAGINKPVTLVDREGNEITEYVIPNGVDSIGTNAFNNCTGLTGMTIPQAVTSVDASAFSGCTGLVTVKVIVTDRASFCTNTLLGQIKSILNKPVTLIDGSGNELTEYVIPNGVDSIGTNAFNNCTGLTGVTFPQSVTSIGTDAFASCSGLTKVNVKVEDMATFCINQLVKQIRASINKPVTLIDLEGNEITEYVIPDGVTSIGSNAFNNCRGLTGVTIPESVTGIGKYAFYLCSSLATVYCYVKTPLTIISGTFSNRANATLYVPFGCKTAYQNANYWNEFKEIIEMEPDSYDNWYFDIAGSTATILGTQQPTGDLVIPSVVYKNGTAYPVTSIGAGAFNGCTGLTSITIPQSVTSIDATAFTGCTNLTGVKVIVTDFAAFCTNTLLGQIKSILDKPVTLIDGSGNELTEYVIPAGVKTIGANAFANCTGLTGVTFPQAVTSIDASAFDGCINLTGVKVVVTDFAAFCTNEVLGLIKSVLNKPVTLTRSNGTEITEYTIPVGVTKIDDSAFANCTGLTSITIPQSVTSLITSAFSGCTGLTGVKVVVTDMATFCTNTLLSKIKPAINQPVTLINNNGSVITEYVIPESVTSIGSSAFVNCTGLTSVTIPESVTNIGSGAFNGCTNLTTVYCYVPTPLSIGSTTFSNRANATLYVPYGSKSAYQKANYWKEFREIIEMDRVLTDSFVIGDFAFNNYNNLSVVEVSSSNKNMTLADLGDITTVSHNGKTYTVTEISANAFKDCKQLVAVYLPDNEVRINAGAFKGCSNLKRIICESSTPPDFGTNSAEDVFDESHFSSVALEVWRQTSQYKSNPQWKKFNKILIRSLSGAEIQGTAKVDNSSVKMNCRIFSNTDLLVQTGYYTPDDPNWSTQAISNINSGVLRIPETVKYNKKNYSVTLLGACSFGGVHISGLGMDKVVVPNSVYDIGAECFANCKSLKGVVIGDGLIVVGGNAFYGCTSLKDIYVYAIVPPGIRAADASTVFSGVPSNCVLHVPEGSVNAYKNAVGWSQFTNIVKIKPGDETTGIEVLDADTDFDGDIEVYDLNGQRQPTLRRGVNIIRMKDGSTKKVLVK